MELLLIEHQELKIVKTPIENEDNKMWAEELFNKIPNKVERVFKIERQKDIYPFTIKKSETHCDFVADYYIGVDWLIEGEKFVRVEPKVNFTVTSAFKTLIDCVEGEDNLEIEEKEEWVKETLNNSSNNKSQIQLKEIDFLKMLLDLYAGDIKENLLQDLVVIDWKTKRIPVNQNQDQLTPFLVVQFLQLLKKIVKKGLKKSYYYIQENLNSRVKGKILIGQQLKKNVFQNKMTSTYCQYQVFGEDNFENRFLKKVFRFTSSYIDNNKSVFKGNLAEVQHLLNYCRPAFEHIGEEGEEYKLKNLKQNSFFKEYIDAIKIGQFILKKFSYNITQTSQKKVETPPFWIDMPRLFELFVYQNMLRANSQLKNKIHYQFATYGNELDILVSDEEHQMVIDTKYKMHYIHGQIHNDIRQVSGYARLKKVRRKLNVNDDRNIDCLIIYPDLENGLNIKDLTLENIKNSFEENEIKAYHKIYKLGVKLPVIDDDRMN